MKKDSVLKMMTIMAMSMATISVSQAATITIPDGNINPGGYYNASVSIDSKGEEMFYYRGFQFDLEMTSSISVDAGASKTLPGFILNVDSYRAGTERFVVYTEGDAVNTADNILTIAFKAAADAQAGPNIIKIDNVVFSTPMGWDLPLDESQFTITITVEPGPGPEQPETPWIPTDYVPEGMYGNANGTYVSALKIREGNSLGMGVNQPMGGYADGWEFEWLAPDSGILGYEREIWTSAELYGEAANAGKNQAVSSNVYNVEVANYDPEGGLFWEKTLPTATVQVYKRPQIPTQLLRKGQHPEGGQTPETGTSCTFVVMMTPLSNQEILDLGYTYTYGYTDQDGAMHEIETTELRYSHTTYEIYNNPSYTFWAYSRWTYPDGSVITSGLRYLDGSEDPDFDASVIDGTRASKVNLLPAESGEETVTAIYTLDGRYAGTDPASLEKGIYIIQYTNSVKKVKI